MDEAAFNRGPGRHFGFFERRKIRKVLYEDYFPKFEKIATECATAFSKAQEMRPDGCVNPVKECVLQLARSPCKDFIKLALRIHPNAIVGLVRLPTFICRVLQFTETDPDIRHSGLAFPFRCYGDNLSDWELGWRFIHQCPATLGVVTMDSAANNALKKFYEDALEQIASNAFASVGATTLEIFGQQDAPGPVENAAVTRFQELMRDADLCDIRWLKNHYIEDTRGNEAGEVLRRLSSVSTVFFEQTKNAVRMFDNFPEKLLSFSQNLQVMARNLEDVAMLTHQESASGVHEKLSRYVETLAQFDTQSFKQNHEDFLTCLKEFGFEVEQYHQTGKDSLRLWFADPNRPSVRDVFSKNARKVNDTFQLLYDVISDLIRFSADPVIWFANDVDAIQASLQTLESEVTTLDGDNHAQLVQEIVHRLNSLVQTLEERPIPDANYNSIFNTMQTIIEPLVKLGQLRFMPGDLIDLLDPTWEMPQSRQLLHLREKMENSSFSWY